MTGFGIKGATKLLSKHRNRAITTTSYLSSRSRGIMTLSDAYKKYDEKKPDIIKGATYAGGGVMLLGKLRMIEYYWAYLVIHSLNITEQDSPKGCTPSSPAFSPSPPQRWYCLRRFMMIQEMRESDVYFQGYYGFLSGFCTMGFVGAGLSYASRAIQIFPDEVTLSFGKEQLGKNITFCALPPPSVLKVFYMTLAAIKADQKVRWNKTN
jgi:hypothetical protein